MTDFVAEMGAVGRAGQYGVGAITGPGSHPAGPPVAVDTCPHSVAYDCSTPLSSEEVDVEDGKAPECASMAADTCHVLGRARDALLPGDAFAIPLLSRTKMAAQATLERSATYVAHEALARELCPLFHLHSRDPWGPSSIEFYLAHCALFCGSVQVVARGQLDGAALAAAMCELRGPDGSVRVVRAVQAGTGWSLRPDPSCFGGFRDRLSAAPVYVRVRDDGRELVELTYVTFYPYNGWYPVLCGLVRAGAHAADIEHITLRVHKRSRSLHSVYFASHRYRDGEWKDASGCEREDGTGRLHAYVARAGHGHYWRRGRHPRLYGFGNDVCDGADVWDPQESVVLLDPDRAVKGQEWLQYKGLWGPTSVASMTEQEWFWRECPKSRGWFKRLFCQCAK